MSWLEIIAVSFSLLSVILTVKENRLLWPSGMIGVVAYFFLFYKERLYADMALQCIYFVQSIYGWYFWRRDVQRSNFISSLSTMEMVCTLFCVVIISLFSYYYLNYYTDAALPFWDSLVVALCLVANFLLARKIIENWLFWIAADFIYVALFFYKELYISSGLYIIFLILAILGWLQWKKEIATNKVFS